MICNVVNVEEMWFFLFNLFSLSIWQLKVKKSLIYCKWITHKLNQKCIFYSLLSLHNRWIRLVENTVFVVWAFFFCNSVCILFSNNLKNSGKKTRGVSECKSMLNNRVHCLATIIYL